MISFCLYSLFKGPVSKHTHIPSYWRLVIEHTNLGAAHSAPNRGALMFSQYWIFPSMNNTAIYFHIFNAFLQNLWCSQKPWKVVEYSHFTSPDLSFFLLCFGLCLRRLTFLESIRGLPCLLASGRFLPMESMGRRSEFIHIPAFLPTSLLMVGWSCIHLQSLAALSFLNIYLFGCACFSCSI